MYAHQSGLTLYHTCAYQYDLKENQGIRPRITPGPLRRGTLVHYGYEGALREHFDGSLDPVDAGCSYIETRHREWMNLDYVKPFITDEVRDRADELNDLAQQVFVRSFKALGVLDGKWSTVGMDGKPLVEVELRDKKFSPHWEGLQGTLDWVAMECSTGALWLFDFKTRKVIKQKGYDEMQRQAPLYQHLLKSELGIKTSGTCTYQIRAHVPERPKLNQNSSMSMAQIKTDWPTYKLALLEEGLDPDDYAKIRSRLSPFDRVDRYFRPLNLVQAHYADAQGTAAEIARQTHFGRASNPIICAMCKDMKEFCDVELRGGDTDYLLATDYIQEGRETEVSTVDGFDLEG